MATITNYTCDKCGKVQTTPEQFWILNVVVKHKTSDYRFDSTYKSMEVCRSCLESFGIFAPKPKENEPAPVYPTIEELIKEIVHNTIKEL